MGRSWTKNKKINATLKPKVFVAMSGGVDSSVAAALLKKVATLQDFAKIMGYSIPKKFCGFDIIGVFMKPWIPRHCATECLWEKEREDAHRVAAKLRIPLLTWDIASEYEKYVVKPMINGYKTGITPNPDAWCNKRIKFGVFLKKALECGADFIATGHYVRLKRKSLISHSKFSNKTNAHSKMVYQLLKGTDGNKDQSYFLYSLTQSELKHCLFPVGDLTKTEVRKIARVLQLPVHKKPDSQGICFMGELELDEFLSAYIPKKPGLVVDIKNKNILGAHKGASYYTIGQRQGFTVQRVEEPLYVTKKDIKKNLLYVDKERVGNSLYQKAALIKNVSWVNGTPPYPFEAQVKLRYRQNDQRALVTRTITGLRLTFRHSQRAITPGQVAVIYRNTQMLGGGIIEK